ncbi:4-(cytidine 5'-diphospho)-2-C-methyl-D-erythritol kinase [Coraliomargarita parva]|uniref:4-(cytidine 5'-diphospho)-2-C-methyl-D-erythritol kinase n=1 Tax=Coraliomargarita parva TaxID=3014050 RepID=UPI0022B37647|nr:4-(cytidine 5'-diphospho)-2-C-methyl-D-erythritol kinase [Coraliomargarita parva]
MLHSHASHPAPVSLRSPAKVNLMLSVCGRRADGFHDLVSVVTALDFGDQLTVSSSSDGHQLSCGNGEVPISEDNLILRAARVFDRAMGRPTAFNFELDKQIPMGAGLGGGSSNAAIALKAMNQLSGEPFTEDSLRDMAAEIGSDCPFFVEGRPAVMRGRGERLETLTEAVRQRLSGLPVLVFKPEFSVATAWAYGQLASAAPRYYESSEEAEARLQAFLGGGPLPELLFNSFEAAICQKFLGLRCLLDSLRKKSAHCLMSGSGSACFVIGTCQAERFEQEREIIYDAFGKDVFCIETFVSA